MNALTLWEPWATLVAIGAQAIENRSWPAPPEAIGHPIAVHAGKRLDALDLLTTDDDILAAFREARIDPFTGLPNGRQFDWTDPADLDWLADRDPKQVMTETRGCVVAVARLTGCYRIHRHAGVCVAYYDPTSKRAVLPSAREERFGYWADGRFAWVLSDVVRLPVPVPARGLQGLWEWDAPASARELVEAARAA